MATTVLPHHRSPPPPLPTVNAPLVLLLPLVLVPVFFTFTRGWRILTVQGIKNVPTRYSAELKNVGICLFILLIFAVGLFIQAFIVPGILHNAVRRILHSSFLYALLFPYSFSHSYFSAASLSLLSLPSW